MIATFRVARLTLQTRKLWLVGVATDCDARRTRNRAASEAKNNEKKNRTNT